jgi:hypothetical protein
VKLRSESVRGSAGTVGQFVVLLPIDQLPRALNEPSLPEPPRFAESQTPLALVSVNASPGSQTPLALASV